MTKIKGVLVDQKRHIRFGEWNGNDVSYTLLVYLLWFEKYQEYFHVCNSFRLFILLISSWIDFCRALEETKLETHITALFRIMKQGYATVS